ncbi:MAG: prolyl oligopeptidase family serine peptidase [Opitutus sp.]
MTTPPRPCTLLLLSFLAVCPLTAREEIKLDRRTPVPANEPIPIADFFRPSFLEDPVINPAGTHVAAIMAAGEDRHKLLVQELGTKKVEGFDAGGDNDVRTLTWLNDQRLAFHILLFKTGSAGLYATDVGRVSNPYPLLQFIGPRLIAVPQTRRTRPLAWISANTMNAGRNGEAVVINTDIRTGQIADLTSITTSSLDPHLVEDDNQKHIEKTYVGPTEGHDAGFMADRDGNLAYGFTALNGVFTMWRRVDERWEKCPVNLDDIDVLGYGRTPTELLVLGPRKEGQPRPLQFIDGVTGKLGDVLLQDKAYDFSGQLYYDPGTRNVLGARLDRAGPSAAWFDETYVALQKVLDGYFPGKIVRVIGADEAGRTLIVETFSDRHPPSFHSINLEKRTFGPIGESMPWIDPERMQRTNIVPYKTRDGRKLDAYLTLPAGASKTNPVPLVVLPPGLPGLFRFGYGVDRTRAAVGFHAQTQMWVSRGYAVLRPNHRGSEGYSWLFPATDVWEFGKMAEDVAAATRHLLSSGLIDQTRVGIVGFGDNVGYLAVAAAEEEPDLFKAIVAFQGIYDWSAYLRDEKTNQYRSGHYGIVSRHLGDEKKTDAMSANGRLNRLHAAVLVGYQRDGGDTSAQSTRLLSDLNRANVPNESIAVGNERSTLNLLRNRVDLFSRAEEFLAKHLHPSPPAAAVIKK